VAPHGLLRDLTDSALIRRFLDGGDEEAFRALHERHTPRLRMLLSRILGTRREEVDDVMQDAWLAGCRGLRGFNGTSQFSTWLSTIGIRAAWTRISPPANGDGTELDDVPAPQAPAASTVIDLERALAQLNDRQRAVVVLHDVEGFTHDEIGKHLGMTVSNSKITLFRARQALRRMLRD
jgi:RNA polymerase sigma factor (sigma-70 family)